MLISAVLPIMTIYRLPHGQVRNGLSPLSIISLCVSCAYSHCHCGIVYSNNFPYNTLSITFVLPSSSMDIVGM